MNFEGDPSDWDRVVKFYLTHLAELDEFGTALKILDPAMVASWTTSNGQNIPPADQDTFFATVDSDSNASVRLHVYRELGLAGSVDPPPDLPPDQVVTVIPVDGTSNVVPGDSLIQWLAAARADSYTVYFGTQNPPPEYQSGITTEEVSITLLPNTAYYYNVNAVNTAGTTAGALTTFSTGDEPVGPPEYPDKVTYIAPLDGAVDVPISYSFLWNAAALADSYDVYMNDVIQTNTTELSFTPEFGLSYDTAYTWRVDSKNAAGVTLGDTASFTTEAEPVGGDTYTNWRISCARGSGNALFQEVRMKDGADADIPFDGFTGTPNEPEKVNDGAASYWSMETDPGTLDYSYNDPVRPAKFTMQWSTVGLDRGPPLIELYAGNDGTNWTLIQSYTPATNWGSAETRVFDVDPALTRMSFDDWSRLVYDYKRHLIILGKGLSMIDPRNEWTGPNWNSACVRQKFMNSVKSYASESFRAYVWRRINYN